MEDIAQKIKNARLKKGLSIAEISEKTKIRPHIIEAFEKNNFSVMPAIYVKSFLKTLFKELDIKESPTTFENSGNFSEEQSEASSSFKIKPLPSQSKENKPLDTPKNEIKNDTKQASQEKTHKQEITKKTEIKEHPLKQEFRKKSVEQTKKQKPEKPEKPVAKKRAKSIASFDSEADSNAVYTEIFKNNNIDKSYNLKSRNLMIIAIIAVIIAAAAYFIFISDIFVSKEKGENLTAMTEDSAVVISSENKDLFSNFIPQDADSIILKAKSIDTAWLSLDIDGKISEQALMKPGMERRWSAKEYIIITQGNAGAIEYYRNNELLQPFGTKGTVVRNIKITMSEVLNATQSIQDSLRKASNSNTPKPIKKKREIRRIEPSKIEN